MPVAWLQRKACGSVVELLEKPTTVIDAHGSCDRTALQCAEIQERSVSSENSVLVLDAVVSAIAGDVAPGVDGMAPRFLRPPCSVQRNPCALKLAKRA